MNVLTIAGRVICTPTALVAHDERGGSSGLSFLATMIWDASLHETKPSTVPARARTL